MPITLDGTAGITTPEIISTGGPVVINASAPDNSMVMDASGNVGIGAAPVGVKFDVYTSGTATSIMRSRNDSVQVYLDANNGFSFLNTPTNHPMLFGTNNTERMRITSVGSIQTPTQPLIYLEGNNGNTINFTSGQQLLVSTYYTQTVVRGDISWNSTTGRVTANTTGQYMLTFAGYENGPSGRVMIYRSGSGINLVHWSGGGTRAIAFPIAMTAGNYIEILADAADLPQLYMGLQHTHFSLYLIG
jgi:hypothetical protein